jgi:hypothetical protein
MQNTSQAGFIGGVGKLADSIKGAVKDAFERHALAREFADCAANGQLDAVCADAGFTRGALRRVVANHSKAPRLLAEMSGRLGIDVDAIQDGTIRREIQRTCSLCETTGQCRSWLRSGQAEGFEAFCPNAKTFKGMLPPSYFHNQAAKDAGRGAVVDHLAADAAEHRHDLQVFSQVPPM